jgi:energy-coupling factor transport system substrate-specific component
MSTIRASAPSALRLRGPSTAVLTLSSLIGVIAFGWPFVIDPDVGLGHERDAPLLFAVTLLMVVVVLMAEIVRGGIDAKALAMLGVLAALGAALRPLGGGVTGFQPMFLVIILGGRALGPGFGFVLGLLTMLGSAVVTGGVGPWLPFQMLGAAWMGLGAGLLPRASGRREVWLVAGYGALASVAYGFLLNLWFWPFTTGLDSELSFVAGDPVVANLRRLIAFSLLTSLGFDLVRAAGTLALTLMAGGLVLRALRRASRRAAFGAVADFGETSGWPPLASPEGRPASASTTGSGERPGAAGGDVGSA